VEFRNIYKELSCGFVMVVDKRGMSKVFVLVILGLFLVSLMSGFVVAADESTAEKEAADYVAESGGGTVGSRILEKINIGGFSSVSDSAKASFARILFILLVILMVYAVASELPFLKGEGKDVARWGVSIIVGILSFIFIPSADVMAILTSYEALGVALTSVIPLVILLVFSWELKKSHPEVSKIIDKPLMILFSVYLLYRWLNLPEGSNLGYIYIITVLISLAWALGLGTWLAAKYLHAKYKERKQAAVSKLNKSIDYSNMTAAAFDKLSKEDQEDYVAGFKN